MKNLILFSICVLLLCSCEEIMPVIPQPPVAGERVVLMEELSGGNCVPCADAAKIIREISAQYQKNFVPVTIHTFMDGSSLPYPGAKYDFRTEKGHQLVAYFDNPGAIPVGAINRKKFPGEDKIPIPKSKWNSLVQQEISEEAILNLGLDLKYDDASRKLDINVNIIPLSDLTGDFRLVVLVNESKLIDKQAVQEGDGLDPAFEHNHILRDIITPITGEPVSTTLTRQATFTKSFSYIIPQDDQDWWIASNMEVVVFVVNLANGSKEVLQAKAGHFAE